MSREQILKLDPLIHVPARLAILSILVTIEDANFSFLKEAIGTTDGNLSVHLAKLETNGFITIQKSFQGKKPKTTCAITKKGRKAFIEYLEQMEQIISVKKT
ncbi:MAG: transcriptional regulator [Candidatus Aminicenantes bacterium]|nr:transcriptional regulator [Candidatus Aminicenantes bacterium]